MCDQPAPTSESFIIQDMGEEIIIYSPENHMLYRLNSSGSDIFRAIRSCSDIEDAVKSLGETYDDIDQEKMREEIQAYVIQLKEQGLDMLLASSKLAT